jgi:Mg2+ and Co2+ transporter CorA
MLIQFKFDTFWLKIEQFWPFEEISIFSHGCHLGYRTALTDIISNLNCISIMKSFLTYITGFFMNFELLPILTDYAN